jgi:hypothetical protein
VTRRSALGLLLLAACGGRTAPPAASPRRTELKIDPLTDLVPAAELVWLLDLRPQQLMASAALPAAIAQIVPDARFDAFAATHAGVDLRSARELVVASYPDAMLAMVETPVNPASVEAAFAARVLAVEGRAVEGDAIRTWGTTTNGSREQVAILGRDAVAIETGKLGTLRAVIAFAEGKLHRAQPALRADPLSRAASSLGDAPARLFAPGPFEGQWASGLGGLLRATTAAAVGAWPLDTGNLFFRIALLGGWGDDAPAAAERLLAAFELLTDDPLGKLMGADHPTDGPRVGSNADALVLDVSFDALTLARGLRAATAGTVADIMRF